MDKVRTRSSKNMPRRLKKNPCLCLKCKVGFKSKAALDSHSCALNKDPAREEEEILSRPINVIMAGSYNNAYQCVLCFKVFKTLKGCNVHMNYCRLSGCRNAETKDNSEEDKEPNPVRRKRRETKNVSSSSSDVDDMQEIDNPVKKIHKSYVCSKCDKVTSNLHEYRKHMKSEHPTYDLVSGVDYSTKASSLPIISSVTKSKAVPSTTNATSNLMHECPNCLQKFRKIGSFRRHLRSHLNIHSYNCKHCLVSYLSKSELVTHIKQLHGGEKDYVCTLCNKKFHHSIGFRKHKSEHLSSPPYPCFQCDAVFPSVAKQLTHISNHAISCPFCRKPMANEKDLMRHTISEHAEDMEDGDFLSETSECDESDSSDELNTDFNEVDVESDADSYTSIESDSEERSPKTNAVFSPRRAARRLKRHVCFICERRFPKQRSLEFHMKTHKIYSCLECSKFFGDSSELQAHQREHLQNNSSFYSKAFNDLQLTIPQQPALTTLPVPDTANCTTIEPQNVAVSSSEATQDSATDYIAWYSGFKDMAKHLKYPIGLDLCQSINQVIADLATTLCSPEKIPPETKESYIKIYNELTSTIYSLETAAQ